MDISSYTPRLCYLGVKYARILDKDDELAKRVFKMVGAFSINAESTQLIESVEKAVAESAVKMIEEKYGPVQ